MSLAQVVERTLKRNGQPAVLAWSPDFLSDDADTTLNTFALVQSKSVRIADGTWQRRLSALLPATVRDVAGASLTVGSSTYTVTKLDATYKGAELVMQEVLLS